MIQFQQMVPATPRAEDCGPLFPQVVAGIDFSPASLAACRWAIEHVAHSADAVLAHIVPYAPQSSDGHGAEDHHDEDEDEHTLHLRLLRGMAPALSGGLGGFAATLDVASARTVVRVGRPSHWLGTLAAHSEASLIVVGRRSDANRRRVGEANVVERLTRRTSAPVLVVPEGVITPPRCIVAAIDEGPSGAEVLGAATAIAAAHGYPLTVVHVLPPTSGAYDRVIGGAGRPRGGRAPHLDAAPLSAAPRENETPHWLVALVRDARTSVRGRIELAVGDPAREIVAAGVASGGGLLVVGKRGMDESPVGSIGSVARDLLATSPLPVLAVDIRPSVLP